MVVEPRELALGVALDVFEPATSTPSTVAAVVTDECLPSRPGVTAPYTYVVLAAAKGCFDFFAVVKEPTLAEFFDGVPGVWGGVKAKEILFTSSARILLDGDAGVTFFFSLLGEEDIRGFGAILLRGEAGCLAETFLGDSCVALDFPLTSTGFGTLKLKVRLRNAISWGEATAFNRACTYYHLSVTV